jgi:hypothetical protein
MRAITPEDLKLVAGQDGTASSSSSTSISTVTVTSPPPQNISTVVIQGTRPPPITTVPTNPPPPPPPVVGNPPCLAIAWRTVPDLTIGNEVPSATSPVVTGGTVPGGGTGVGAKSGVTVSYGIDLSWQYPTDLMRAGVSSGAIEQLRPFLAFNMILPIGINGGPLPIAGHGIQGTAAASLLNALPINPPLSAADVQSLFTYAYGIAEGRAISGFENLTGSTFLSLPAAAQSVLADLAFNFGSMSKWPSAMQQALAAQDWATLADLISQLPGTRGKADAQALRTAIADGALAAKGNCS